jgi:hypothetical protein
MMKTASRREIEQAYAEATRAASRGSLMGALGFGLALMMATLLAERGTLLGAGFGLETLLLVGGLGGGLTFTILAARASRMARRCRRELHRTRR